MKPDCRTANQTLLFCGAAVKRRRETALHFPVTVSFWAKRQYHLQGREGYADIFLLRA